MMVGRHDSVGVQEVDLMEEAGTLPSSGVAE